MSVKVARLQRFLNWLAEWLNMVVLEVGEHLLVVSIAANMSDPSWQL